MVYPIIFLFLFFVPLFQSMGQPVPAEKLFLETIIFKVKPEFRDHCKLNSIAQDDFMRVAENIRTTTLKKKFPNHTPPSLRPAGSDPSKNPDLSLIYEMTFTSRIPMQKVINALLQTGIIEYAQPKHNARHLYTPNDPDVASQQYYLYTIRAIEAWDIEKGDTTIVIGITDTGNDPDHPDLAGNVKHNYSDTLDGVDNDNDGFTDNFSGWDLADNDNDPSIKSGSDWLPHGSQMAGLATGVADNLLGIAGTAFGCKFLPVKVSTDAADFNMGFEGIVYAADHGAQIINCSWGGTESGPFEQEVIDYATLVKKALVVAAGGNDGDQSVFYPASYNYVLSVGGTDANDEKYYSSPTNSSNYGIYIDLCAPGKGIYTTTYDNLYIGGAAGTSCSSAITSGCAAIVKSYRPWLLPMQIALQLKMTCDVIDTIPNNLPYAGKLGSGRINLFRALTDTLIPGIALISKTINDGNDEFYIAGDTLRIIGNFINYLAAAANVDVLLSSTSSFLNFQDGNTSLGAMTTLQTASNTSDPFRIYVSPSTPYNSKAAMKLTYQADTFSSFEYFEAMINPDYMDFGSANLKTTITSKSRIGYNDTLQLSGRGISYKGGASLAYEAGFMVGNTPNAVSDNVSGTTVADNDFKRVSAVRHITPPDWSDSQISCAFNDDNAGINKLKVTVTQNTYSWSEAADSGYIILEYTIRNKGTAALNTVYAGIYCDWDIHVSSFNRAGFDPVYKMGYVYSSQFSSPYCGVKLLSASPVIHYSVDNVAGVDVWIDPTDGFSSQEKYRMLSTNRHTAGNTGPGNDVIDVVSSGPFQITPGDSVKIYFALIVADSLEGLKTSAQLAQNRYDSLNSFVGAISGGENEFAVYPNPAGDFLIIEKQNPAQVVRSVSIVSLTGESIITQSYFEHQLFNKKVNLSLKNLPSGVYFCRITSAHGDYLRKITVIR